MTNEGGRGQPVERSQLTLRIEEHNGRPVGDWKLTSPHELNAAFPQEVLRRLDPAPRRKYEHGSAAAQTLKGVQDVRVLRSMSRARNENRALSGELLDLSLQLWKRNRRRVKFHLPGHSNAPLRDTDSGEKLPILVAMDAEDMNSVEKM